jgi:hypothetical protein
MPIAMSGPGASHSRRTRLSSGHGKYPPTAIGTTSTMSAAGFERRFVGRVENGRNLISDPVMAT